VFHRHVWILAGGSTGLVGVGGLEHFPQRRSVRL
jgi:hypothetical protein